MTRLLILASASLFVAGCEKEIPVNVPAHQPRLVLHSVTAVGDSLRVQVSRSVGVVQYNPMAGLQVTDATVVLIANGVPTDTLTFNPFTNDYESGQVIQLGVTYALRVSAPGMTDAYAEAVAWNSVAVQSLGRNKNVKVNSNGNPMDELIITFIDPPGRDYYRFGILIESFFFYACAQSTDPSVVLLNDEISGSTCLTTNAIFVTDALFDGQQKELRITIDQFILDPLVDTAGQVLSPKLRLETLSEPYFRHLETSEYARWNQNNPFAEPVNVFTNVVNGFGVFAVVGRTELPVPE